MSKETPLVKVLTSIGEFITRESLDDLMEGSTAKYFTFKTVTSELPYKGELYGCEEEITLNTNIVEIHGFAKIDELERKVPMLETLLEENEDVKTISELLKPEVLANIKDQLKLQLKADLKGDMVENIKDSLRAEAYNELKGELSKTQEA